jgi:hypothetical protein
MKDEKNMMKVKEYWLMKEVGKLKEEIGRMTARIPPSSPPRRGK